MKQMKFKLLFPVMFSLLVLTTVVAVTESDVPDLTNFQQFYGRISQLPQGTFTLKVQSGTLSPVLAAVAADGSYGYSEVVKVTGTAGDAVTFTIINRATGAPTLLGTEPYSPGGVMQKDWQYSGSVVVSNASVNASGDGNIGGSGRRDSTSRGRSSSGPVVSSGLAPACLQSWDCGLWSACLAGIQTRSCVRSDSCDAQLARRAVSSITPIPKPSEQQSCQPEKSAGTVICPKTSKRCLDKNLQQCSNDGTQWITIQSCSEGCNSVLLVCRTSEEAVQPSRKFPWVPVIAGGIGLVVVIGMIIIMARVRKKKHRLQPVRDYISTAKARGFSDEAIISKLAAQGWNREQIEKILGK